MRKRRAWMGGAAVAVTIGIILGCGGTDDGRDRVSSATPPVSLAPAAPSRPPLTESEEVKGSIRFLWPHVLKAEAVDFTWAGCHERTTGYDELLTCVDGALADVRAVKSGMPTLVPKTTCGKETATELLGYVDRREAYLNAMLGWVRQNATTLRPLLRNSTLSKLSVRGEPADPDVGQGLLSATDAPCIVKELACVGFCPAPVMDRAAGIASH